MGLEELGDCGLCDEPITERQNFTYEDKTMIHKKCQKLIGKIVTFIKKDSEKKAKERKEFKEKYLQEKLVFYCEDCKKGFDSDSLADTGNEEESFATCPCCGLEELPCITRTEFNQTIYNYARFKGQKPYAKKQGRMKEQ